MIKGCHWNRRITRLERKHGMDFIPATAFIGMRIPRRAWFKAGWVPALTRYGMERRGA